MITITVPSEWLSLEFWTELLKNYGWQSAVALSVLYGVISHFSNILAIRRWNAMTTTQRQIHERMALNPNEAAEAPWARKHNITDQPISPFQSIFVFVVFCVAGLAFRSGFAGFRLLYNVLLWPILSLIAGQSTGRIPSFNNLFGTPKGLPALRFITRSGDD